ncbi:imipenem/basic amino acid-specific outer membrane pore [Aquipseudomonas alcaligenes]|uniref:OprD family porin n=1 Tax=Aquipseudomonas alcaligenes TaxID=43263 RepID=UPI0009550CEC|nr:OprD family porin [Pseudomonas alcaligenes]SIS24099.1 imipenem/basic amino acid-specific outer membrane pore [Pseudomonas alcaligenes]
MQVMKWSALALAVTAGTTQLAFASAQSESKGFVEDSSFDIFNRALYMNRDFKHGYSNVSPANKVKGDRTGYREETGLGIRLLFESGFTQGTVGVGVDAHSLSNIKLDSGRGRHSNGIFATTDEGRADDTTSEVGGAIKFRISDTVLKYGNQFVASPVFSTDDSRTLPEVATGTYLVSNEIEGLELSAGRFTAMNSQTNTSRDSLTDPINETTTLKSANIFGVSYAFTDNLSASFHASDVEDYWKKQYVNVNYTLPLADEQSLNFDLNAYRSKDDGDALGSELDNKVWSLLTAYSVGAHKFTVGYQQSSGDTGYLYGIDGGGTVWVGNSVQISDFVGQDEKSWQVRYDLDMTTFGVPGLSFMTRYITGEDITIAGTNEEGKEHEWNAEAKYVIQEGAAKDLSFRVRHAVHRANTVENGANFKDLNDTRVIVEYPLDVL